MNLENRISVVEEAIIIMKDLLVSHDDRLESYFNALTSERSARERIECRAQCARRIT